MNLFTLTQPLRDHRWFGLFFAAIAVLAPYGIRLLLGPMALHFPFVIFIPFVVLTTFLGGLIPGVVAAILSGLIADVTLIAPSGSIWPSWPEGWTAMFFYVVTVGIDIALIQGMIDANKRTVVAERISRDLNNALQKQVRSRTHERDRAQELATIVEGSRDAIWSWTADGTIMSWNAEAERMFGYASEEIVGKSILTLIPSDRIKRAHDIIAQVSEGETYVPWETIRLRKDGTPVHVELAVFPLPNTEGRPMRAATICRDITERKRGEETRTRYLRMLDLSRDAIVVRDAKDRITQWNLGASELYGWTRDEALGQVTHVLLQTKFPKPLDEIIGELMRDGRWAGELMHSCKDGHSISVFSRWTVERDEQGQRAFILESNLDITERKQVEARVAADLRDMTQFNELSNQLVRSDVDVNANLNAVLKIAIGVTRADKGNVQLFDPTTGTLTIAAHLGFEPPFLKFFERVREDASACSTAMRTGERAEVEDVTSSEIFAGHPGKDVLLDAGVRAVVSIPLIDSNDKLLGMVSVHFGTPHRLTERERGLTDLLARLAADYLERKQAEQISGMLVREVQHRANNLLAVVQTIASRSLSGDYSLAEAKTAFEARLQALARTTRHLTRSNWIGVNLKEIVVSELEPFSERVIIEGHDVSLDPKQAQDISLALHELATNAAKHGALSNGSGIVKVSWAQSTPGESATLEFTWRESGGPSIAVPTRSGFGTALLKATFPHARTTYAPDGFNFEVDLKLGRGHA